MKDRNTGNRPHPGRILPAMLVIVLILAAPAMARSPAVTAAATPAPRQETGYGNVAAIVVSVYDGDTLTVDIPAWPAIVGSRIGVRVAGIDTPELRDEQPTVRRLAELARDLAREFLPPGRSVELRGVRRDKYFRLLADVYVGDRSLAGILLDQGLAKPYDGGRKEVWH